ncbi:DNA-directed DNA polymerase [Caerostris extrusa]|uniref:DNA-directed DNA polymerase n=1 Tax=Caerostris extrusa TaxID=172846 RepID=A0AAV4PAL7_CAEEX|nr:DNA-directed DNA polymerase [Caerostris extrusa]
MTSDVNNIRKNPGRRLIATLALNSFWDFKDEDSYFSLILCRVIPPRALYLPVLPYRCQGKLMFPLCRTCTENMQQTACTNSNEERSLIGTWVRSVYLPSEEVAAIQWQSSKDFVYQDTSTNIFIAAVTTAWARLKLYEEMDNSDFKDEDSYFSLILCRVIPPRALYLPVLPYRCQGKLMFPLCRTCTENMQQTACTNSNEELSLIGTWVRSVYLPSEEVAAIQWQSSKDFVYQDTSTNIFIAAVTTAWARLKLYEEMDNSDFKDEDSYFSLILCRVIPPRALYLPVLPYRCQGKLMFPLCRTCTENMQQTACTNSNEELSLIGTWGEEDFKDEDSYFSLILCRVIPPRALYLPVLPYRCQGKLMFPLCRTCTENMQQTACTNSNEELSLIGTWVRSVYLPSEEVAAIQWQSSKDFVYQDTSTNIFIAAVTTAWARLKLYEEMDNSRDALAGPSTPPDIYIDSDNSTASLDLPSAKVNLSNLKLKVDKAVPSYKAAGAITAGTFMMSPDLTFYHEQGTREADSHPADILGTSRNYKKDKNL